MDFRSMTPWNLFVIVVLVVLAVYVVTRLV